MQIQRRSIFNPKGVNRNLKKKIVESINNINIKEHQKFNDPEVLTRINQYEMAFKMQVSVPDVMNINNEPEYIKEMYGINPGKESFANNCLLARKMVEKGVRFVQLYDYGWDSHGDNEATGLTEGFLRKCQMMDRFDIFKTERIVGRHSCCLGRRIWQDSYARK